MYKGVRDLLKRAFEAGSAHIVNFDDYLKEEFGDESKVDLVVENKQFVFYIDVGNLPKSAAEQYLNHLEKKFSCIVPKPIILARPNGSKATEVCTIPVGEDYRRVFYIDVGNLPASKAQEYLESIMKKYKTEAGDEALILPRRAGQTITDVWAMNKVTILEFFAALGWINYDDIPDI